MSRRFDFVELPDKEWKYAIMMKSTKEQVGMIVHHYVMKKFALVTKEALTIGELEEILEFMKQLKPTDSVQQHM